MKLLHVTFYVVYKTNYYVSTSAKHKTGKTRTHSKTSYYYNYKNICHILINIKY